MRLTPEQREQLAELFTRRGQVIAAEAAVQRQIEECWRAMIPARQIAGALGVTTPTVIRNYSSTP